MHVKLPVLTGLPYRANDPSCDSSGDLQPSASELADLTIPYVPTHAPLMDGFSRVHRSVRLSVTDVCNLRCLYCMPDEGVHFLPNDRLLSFEQHERIVRLLAQCGVYKVRLTGGEPLVRPRLAELVQRLQSIPGIRDIALTTNGMLLADQIDALVAAGLQRVNISLDTLRDETFRKLARRDGLERVLRGVEAACSFPGIQVRINTLLLRDINLDDLIPLVRFARERNLEMRFIEFMPLDAERKWNSERMVSAAETRQRLEAEFGCLQPLSSQQPQQTSRSYAFLDGGSQVGFISSVTEPFCHQCDRLRITAEGYIRNCLFSRQDCDLTTALTSDDDNKLEYQIRECLAQKSLSHGGSLSSPSRTMHRIGG